MSGSLAGSVAGYRDIGGDAVSVGGVALQIVTGLGYHSVQSGQAVNAVPRFVSRPGETTKLAIARNRVCRHSESPRWCADYVLLVTQKQ